MDKSAPRTFSQLGLKETALHYRPSTNAVSLVEILWRASATIDHRLWTMDKSAPRTFSQLGLKETALDNGLWTKAHPELSAN